jgi:dipeptidyl-peptidase-4
MVRNIEMNEGIKVLQELYAVSKVEFIQIGTDKNVELNGYVIKPPNFDPSQSYPLFMYQYSGPGSQSANNAWKGNNYWWFQLLAQKGYIVACVDGRGTGMRGEEFKKITYLNLGKYETTDQIDAAKYFGSLPYVDKNRIGIYGWSYGGYMSSLCLLKGNDVFKGAIAVAPVTSWKWYDTIYTERYMRTLTDNEAGYRENSPVYFADRLKGKYLLVHGIADDNVHFQNSVEMANALIKANKQFDTYYYPNRNHGIYGDNARIHLFTKMTNFILENI